MYSCAKVPKKTVIAKTGLSALVLLKGEFFFLRKNKSFFNFVSVYLGTMIFDIIQIFLRGYLVGIAASITVGPVAVLCIQRTLSKTTRSGLFSGLGVALADTLMAIIAFFFYSMLEAQIQQYNQLLRVIGGICVVVVGIYIFFQNPLPQIRRNRAGNSSSIKDMMSMFGFTMANFVVVIPYILAFFAMFGVGISSPEQSDIASISKSTLVIAGFFCGAITWWATLTGLISIFRRRFRPRHMLTINHVAGIIVGILGFYTILSIFITITPHGVGH